MDVVLGLQNRDQAYDFLVGVLTPAELEILPMRLEIVRRLKKGVSQTKIAKELGVGIATVTRGSREIKQKRFKYI